MHSFVDLLTVDCTHGKQIKFAIDHRTGQRRKRSNVGGKLELITQLFSWTLRFFFPGINWPRNLLNLLTETPQLEIILRSDKYWPLAKY